MAWRQHGQFLADPHAVLAKVGARRSWRLTIRPNAPREPRRTTSQPADVVTRTGGSYRLDGRLVIFTLITTAGTRSLWAYVPVAPGAEQAVAEARFETEDEFNDFLAGCFTGREVVFTAAENLVITSKSDGIRIPVGRNALLAMGAKWYAQRSAALYAELQKRLETAVASEPADPEELLSAAQGVIETLPVQAK